MVQRAAGGVGREEGIQNVPLKGLLDVQDVVRDAELRRRQLGVVDVQRGAAPLNARRQAPHRIRKRKGGGLAAAPSLIRHAGGTSGRVDLDATPPTRVTMNSNVAVDKD